MIRGIHSFGIPVQDQEAALDFYVSKLGWEVRTDQQVDENLRFLTVAPKGEQTAAYLMKVDGDLHPDLGISLNADNVQATYNELTAKGVEFTMPVTDMPWGDKGAHFVDLDGNTFFLNGPA